MRPMISLDGFWQFRHEGDASWRQVTVPNPWQADCADLRLTSGRAVYRRQFAHPGQGAHVLRFGAVNYLSEVFLNGVKLGENEGGYLPFEFPLPDGLLKAENEVEVRVLLPDGRPNDRGIDFADIPHGKQSWYGPLGGIWQSVAIETRAAAHLKHCAITALPSGEITVKLELSHAAKGLPVTLAVGPVSATLTGAETLTATLTHPAPTLWSPDHPNLHELVVTLGDDVTRHRFGFRSFEARGGRMYLNGEPFHLRSALDQDYWPEGICTPPSVEALEDQFRKAKELGLNNLRYHIKVPDPRYLEVADRLGMTIWYDLPNPGRLTDGSKRRLKETMAGMLKRDGNHPSVIIWTLINEDWGIRLCDDPAHRDWLAGMVDWLKAEDPSRLVCDNSPCQGNFHVKGDLDDFHYYRSIPERRDEWDALVREHAAGAAWTWTPFGDGVRKGDEVKICSEFGVWGLPQPAQVKIDGQEPWWMETGALWGDGAAYPHGIETRFAGLGMDRVFGSLEAFVTAAQWYQFGNLKYEIERMRSEPSIMGHVITEITDVHWESNGLLDMNRNPRVFHSRFAEVNGAVAIVPDIARYSARSGEVFRFKVKVASGERTLQAGELRWAGGSLPFAGASPLEVVEVGEVALTFSATENRVEEIVLELVIGGQVIQTNRVQILLFAPRARPLVKVAAQGALADRARTLGYTLVPAPEAEVVLAHALSDPDIRALQAGARYLVLADGNMKTEGNLRVEQRGREQPFIPVVDDRPGVPIGPVFPLPNITLQARHGTMWRGDWIAGFTWLRREGAFASIPGGPLLDVAWSGVVPRHVMHGWAQWEFAGPVISAVVVGWVHKPAVLIGRRTVGEGEILASTYRLMGADDPLADALFDALVAETADPQA
ncbi:glycoside hydrolase family 2 protein [Stagnihabitans tardus]|uniref:Glycoside hydrolase family 2 n=1 Tax=Stagnihabitans tardus TaxID=2699202 RepID=A0AAE4Y5R6_9RHOB|nr:sugar-binding domain-containing protein [Stagnihabitans tardus]NBZ86247.1 glycoside hydrolase family 2 [Stagnihabitans tardus]